MEEAEVQTETFRSPWNSPDEIHYHSWQINKEWDCLWWRTDAPSAGGKAETNISFRSAPGAQYTGSFGTSYCIVSHLRTATALSKAYSTIMLPDRIPSGNSGISELSRICPPASCEAPEHLAHYLPVSGSSCLPSAVNYTTAAFKMKAQRLEEHKQGRATWAKRKSWAGVCSCRPTVSIIGRNRRQFRVTHTDTDCPRRRMTTKAAVGSRQVFGKEKKTKGRRRRWWSLGTYRSRTAKVALKSDLCMCC